MMERTPEYVVKGRLIWETAQRKKDQSIKGVFDGPAAVPVETTKEPEGKSK